MRTYDAYCFQDAHNCCLDFDSDVSLFAVYDGHGGAEVAEYASQHLPNIIKETPAYKEKDFNTALKDAFLRFDATLVTEPVMEELKKIAGSKVKTAGRWICHRSRGFWFINSFVS